MPAVPVRRDSFRLPPADARGYLDALGAALALARPGALFVDRGRIAAWLDFLGRARPRGGPPALDVHLPSGLPLRRTLVRLLTHQRASRSFLAEARLPARRASSSFHVALAACELPAVSQTTARLMHRDGKVSRFLVTWDGLVPLTGLLVRATAQVSQTGQRQVTLARGDLSTPTEAFARTVAFSAPAGAAQLLEALELLDGLTVHETTFTEVGPFVSGLLPAPASARGPAAVLRQALNGLPPAQRPTASVLSLVLERIGDSVPADCCADPFGELPALAQSHRRRGRKCFRERRLVCAPALETPLKTLVATGNRPCIVRSR